MGFHLRLFFFIPLFLISDWVRDERLPRLPAVCLWRFWILLPALPLHTPREVSGGYWCVEPGRKGEKWHTLLIKLQEEKTPGQQLVAITWRSKQSLKWGTWKSTWIWIVLLMNLDLRIKVCARPIFYGERCSLSSRWTIFTLTAIGEQPEGVWRAMETEPRRRSFLWAQGLLFKIIHLYVHIFFPGNCWIWSSLA